jgi:hypothetical protein
LLGRNQWQNFFRQAGLSAEYLPDAFSPRGLYVAKNMPSEEHSELPIDAMA